MRMATIMPIHFKARIMVNLHYRLAVG